MNWNDPVERHALAMRVGSVEYNRLHEQHMLNNVVDTVGGHRIHTVGSQFGTLFMVGSTGVAWSTIDQARKFARENPR